MSILDYGKIIFLRTDDLIEWLQSKRLLAVQSSCPTCGITMDRGHQLGQARLFSAVGNQNYPAF